MRKLILLFIFLASVKVSTACDICGCANGGSFMGIMPNMNQQLIGLRYFSKSYQSHISSKFLGSEENFQTAELRLRIYPAKNLQLMAFLPYQFNEQVLTYDGVSKRDQGFGDARVLLHYNVVNTSMDSAWNSDFNHQLLLGGGVKAPLGKFSFDTYDATQVANANFQLGTGSWDFPLQAIYTLQHKKMGFNMNATYQINGTNKDGYRFANRSVIAGTFFRTMYTQNWTILPLLGIYAEQSGMNQENGIKNELTGGWLTALNVGVEIYTPRFNFSINGQLPVAQNLSDGELEFKSMFSIGILRAF
ncbi:hypothetical protein [Arcticibacterium luteifluviistationis]|uniref:Transporter n=1 Tax=Arcticibacterium luteifluviistationis TaxID=1784714 RepID=A0A2Z4GHB3_9BACT|nr:hypothetical protein [Arcticibacterium luteifluviistationis]AWW00710.1 hypothetical protein DJ013_21980 [Arcticibacterium luteifluviistationis]